MRQPVDGSGNPKHLVNIPSLQVEKGRVCGRDWTGRLCGPRNDERVVSPVVPPDPPRQKKMNEEPPFSAAFQQPFQAAAPSSHAILSSFSQQPF